MLEKVATLRLIEPDDKENFIKAITYFNSLEVAGNMNAEKTYIEFLEKNIELIGAQKKDTWKKMQFKTSMTGRRNYQNEEVFMKLKAMRDNENEEERPSKEEFRKYLDEEYEKGNISLREYRELIRYQC